jgi:phospholipid/cholesterol/gamma-HCH transport system permease protein
MLDLPYETFVERIHSSLDARHVVIGIGKTPVFALAIATIACRLGMTAERDTRSIGIATTSTVVQAIVTVIVIDAAFAVAFQLGKL